MAIVNGSLELGYKNLAWFNANPTLVLKEGQIVYLQQTGTYKIGNGTSTLSALSFLGISSETQTLQNVTDLGATTTNSITANSFIKSGGTASQFLKANGSVDSSTYASTTYVDNQDALKVDKVVGKGLSTNDYTTAEQTKLAGIATGAEVNVNADWNATSGDAQILNKPTIPTVTPSALTKTDDTNVTLTLGGSPSTALLAATSITVGWTGTLADSRITSAATWNAKQDALSGTGFVKSTAGVISYDTNTYLTTTSAASTYVPYTGATGNVDLGTHSLTASDLIINHASGSGVAASITKGGNGEALTVVKSSGSGNVASFTGGNTFISTLTTPTINGVSGNLAFANAVQISGAITAFTFTKPNNTGQTASTQINGFVVNGGTRQWNTGNIGTQSENVWGATTYSFVGASTITNAYGNVFNAPVAGTNATITNNFSAQFNGRLELTSTSSITLNNGTDTMRISRGSGALGRLILSRPGNESVESVSFGGGSSEIRIRNNSASISHDGNEFQLVNSAGTKGLGLFSTFGDIFLYGQGSNGGLKLFGATRNVLIQNGGTFVDNGFRLDVNGTARFQDNISLTQTVTTETVVQTRTVTIVINGTTYKLLAA